MCYTLDIDELRAIVKDIGSKVSNPDTQFESINNAFEKNYGVKTSLWIKTSIYRKIWRCCKFSTNNGKGNKFHYEKKGGSEGETKIILKNPKALYRIGILGFDETIKLDLMVEGNVGNFFGAFCNFDGTWIVDGNAENGLADKGYKGKIIVKGLPQNLHAKIIKQLNSVMVLMS